jgi:hypothetical protein
MEQTVRRLLTTLAVSAALAVPTTHAAVISTDAAQAQDERARLSALMARSEVANQLEKYGIAAHEAQARVAAMNDDEVHQLASQIDALAAGGQVSTQNLLLIIIIVLLVLILL